MTTRSERIATLSVSVHHPAGADVEADVSPPLPVAILRWPEEAASIDRLRAAGAPRLLLVGPDIPAPVGTDCTEDWVRLPADDGDVRVRTLALAARAARHNPSPEVKGDGRVAFRDRWVAVSQTEEAIVGRLADSFGEVVDGGRLAGDLGLTDNAVRVQVMRLRKRIRPLGLVVRTVRGRGYVLEHE
ncbi:MAG TPA: helix-turn-helix domain-containing protein [Acidimicrobiales bacterium]|nr:helix-turn-helix domain-containing protein [Acidimicrobiales bacterium]